MKSRIILSISILQIIALFAYILPILRQAQATSFSQANANLSNPRLSVLGRIASGADILANTGVANMKSSGEADNDTLNIFPKDTICFNGIAGAGCSPAGATPYMVDSTPTSTSFSFHPTATQKINAGDMIVSTQSGTISINFTPSSTVPSGSYLLITIPANTSGNPSDSMPDVGAFDSAGLTSGNISSYINPGGFSISTASLNTANSKHTILMTLSSALNHGTNYSIVVGGNAPYRFINPAPASSHTTRGTADALTIGLETQNSMSQTFDQTNLKVLLNDGVLVSANVEVTLNWAIGAVNQSDVLSIACKDTSSGDTGNAVGTTNSTSVPFGSLTVYNQFYISAHSHTINTNASNGYTLLVRQDGDLTSGTATISKTNCGSTVCTSTAEQYWTDASTYKGFGYGMRGTQATFTTGYRQFDTTDKPIMSNNSPASGATSYICYKLAIAGTQQAGMYFNKLTYTAVPNF
ncbi:hypothetical protein HGB07_07155 [Candidatus Roizmanbacteria bacterium]|nr:hypothetical protein [Candidatus Roizmanbacteria bacterium]